MRETVEATTTTTTTTTLMMTRSEKSWGKQEKFVETLAQHL